MSNSGNMMAQIERRLKNFAGGEQSFASAIFTVAQMLNEYKEEHPRVVHLALRARKIRTRKKNQRRILLAMTKKAKEREK